MMEKDQLKMANLLLRFA